MTTFNYAKMATLAETLLGKFGQSMTLLRTDSGSDYDPHDGSSYVTTTSSAVVGVILPTSTATVRGSEGAIGDFDNATIGGLAASKRRFAILKAKDSSQPQPADVIVDAAGDSYRVTGVTQVSPAGTDIIWRVGLEGA